MKHTFLTVMTVLMLLCSGQVMAQQTPPPPRLITPEERPTGEQLARTFELMRVDTQVRAVTESMITALQQQIKIVEGESADLSTEQRADMEELARTMMERAMKLYPIEEIMDDVATVYQRYLSRDDIDGLNAFYVSPAGQHLLDAQPAMVAEYLPLVMQRLSERCMALEKELKERKREIEQALKN